jgi:hypothetical protein
MNANRFLALATRTALLATLAAGADCKKKELAPGAVQPPAAAPVAVAAGDRLNLLPQEAAFVGGVNVAALRKTKLWASLLEARDKDPKGNKDYQAFTAQTGWDPLASLSGIDFAVPGDVDTSKEFGAVVTSATPIDEKKVVAYLEAKAKEEKQPVERAQHQNRTLYGMKDKDKKSEVWFTFLDDKTIGVGGPTWVKKIVDLSAGKAAGIPSNAGMMGLVQRSNRGAALWTAGQLPPGKGATPLGVTLKSVTASLDFPANGIKVDATTTTASPEEAKKLVAVTNEQVGQLKPMAAAVGLTAALSSFKVQQTAADVSFGVGLTEAEFDGLAGQAKQMATAMIGGMASGMAGGAQASAGGAATAGAGATKAKHKKKH